MPNWKTFEARLRWAIEETGRTREALAVDLGTKGPRLSEWTAGTQPGLDYLQKLPGVLGVDGHWLITGEGEPTPRTPTEAQRILAEIQRLVTSEREVAGKDAGGAATGVKNAPGPIPQPRVSGGPGDPPP